LTPGVRVELIQQTFYDRLANDGAGKHEGNATQLALPGVGAFYAITPSLGVLAGVHRGMSPPVPDSGPGGKPELSTNYEGGVRYWKGPFRMEAVGYYEDY